MRVVADSTYASSTFAECASGRERVDPLRPLVRYPRSSVAPVRRPAAPPALDSGNDFWYHPKIGARIHVRTDQKEGIFMPSSSRATALCATFPNLARLLALIFVAFAGTATNLSAGDITLWDDVESHEWIGENWGGSQVTTEIADFQDRRALHVTVPPTTNGWGIIRTKQFLFENWEAPVLAMQADAWIVGAAPVRLKLEFRGATFDPWIANVTSAPISPGSWQTVTWLFPGSANLSIIGSISIVVEDAFSGADLYLDNLRLLTTGPERTWDSMDDARLWFYFGNWHDWSIIPFPDFPGLELISSLDGCPGSDTASLYLEWDFDNGQGPGLTTAEIGTNNNEAWLNQDLSDVVRVGACVRSSSDQVPIRLFFYDQEGNVGFQTGSAFLQQPDAWQEIVWAVPWPPGFDRSDVDEIKLVVGDIDAEPIGWARFDRLRFFDGMVVPNPPGFPTVITNYDEQHPAHTHLGGNFGALNGPDAGDRVTLRLETDGAINQAGSQATLKVEFEDLVDDAFAGFFTSLLGNTEFPEFSLDVTPWEYLTFDLRGSGTTSDVFNLKVEMKEARGDGLAFDYTAYTYIPVTDSVTDWTTIVLPLDFGDTSVWSLNRFEPDSTKMKELVFVVESHFNPGAGSFFVDNIGIVDTDQPLPPINTNSTDSEVLAYFLETNFSYFRHATNPDTGLTLDRLAFSDLATVAGGGFALTAWCLGAEIGLLTRREAFDYVEQALATYLDQPMGWVGPEGTSIPSEGQIGVNGFYYHFLDSRDAVRKVQTEAGGFVSGSELSSIDTALLLFGVITSRQAITAANGYSPLQEAVVTGMADQILERVDWPFFFDPGSGQVYLGWKPESGSGYTQPHWSGVGFVASRDDCSPTPEDDCLFTWDWTTDEILLIALAGMAAPDPAMRLSPSIFASWMREVGFFAGYEVTTTFPGTAFTYQFANLWLPLADLGVDILGLDWWNNAREGLAANHAFSTMPNGAPSVFPGTFDWTSFGLTACEDPSTRYRAFGAPPAGECAGKSDDEATIDCFLAIHDPGPDLVNGTLAIYGAAASIDYLPTESIAALRHAYFDLELWNNLFGFPDSFNRDMPMFVAREAADGDLDPTVRDRLLAFEGDWFNPVQFSIDQGPIVLALGNYLHDGIVRDWVTSYPEMARALGEAFELFADGFESGDTSEWSLAVP